MTVEIRPARPEDAPGICALLHGHMNPSWPVGRWRRILDYPWRPPGADLGRVVVEGDRIAGFLGLVRVERPVGGTTRRFANLTSWYLLRHLRGTGLGARMLLDATGDESTVFTNLTPARATVAMVRRAGFETLDEERLLFRRDPARHGRSIGLVEGWDGIRSGPDERLRRILADHAAFDLRHAAFTDGARSCHLVLQAKRKAAGRLYLEILFASDTEALARHAQGVADMILPEPGAVLAVDRRFAPDAPPAGAIVEKLPQPRLCKPAGLPTAAIDMLYSEIPLLDLKLP